MINRASAALLLTSATQSGLVLGTKLGTVFARDFSHKNRPPRRVSLSQSRPESPPKDGAQPHRLIGDRPNGQRCSRAVAAEPGLGLGFTGAVQVMLPNPLCSGY